MDFLKSEEARPLLWFVLIVVAMFALWLAGHVHHSPSDGEQDHRKKRG